MNKPRFNLKNKNDKESLIILICRDKGSRFVYSTGLKIPPKHWSYRTMRAKNIQQYIDHVHINKCLENVQAAAVKLLRKHEAERTILTQISFKNEMEAILNGSGSPKGRKDFLSYFDEFIADRKSNAKYAKGSIQVYNNARNHIFKYVRGKKIQFDDLSIDFFRGFKSYLFAQHFQDNHVSKIVSTIRGVLNEASEMGLNSNLAYKSKKVSVSKTEVDSVYLTKDELEKLIDLDLLLKPGFDKTRDLFIVSAYTGFRYSDYSRLSEENIHLEGGKRCFNIITEKTEDRLWIPIHPKVEKILNKYNQNLPTAISNQKTNEHLKEICRLAGLIDQVSKRESKGGKVIEKYYPKWELVTTHTGRRSFATNAYVSGVPMANIMRITGHKKTETFLKYIKFDNRESAIMMAEHPFFSV